MSHGRQRGDSWLGGNLDTVEGLALHNKQLVMQVADPFHRNAGRASPSAVRISGEGY